MLYWRKIFGEEVLYVKDTIAQVYEAAKCPETMEALMRNQRDGGDDLKEGLFQLNESTRFKL